MGVPDILQGLDVLPDSAVEILNGLRSFPGLFIPLPVRGYDFLYPVGIFGDVQASVFYIIGDTVGLILRNNALVHGFL